MIAEPEAATDLNVRNRGEINKLSNTYAGVGVDMNFTARRTK